MSDADDDASKTEEPSERKLGEARGKGQVWNSKELGHWFMFFAMVMILAFMGSSIAQGISRAVVPFFEKPDQIPVDAGNLGRVLLETFWEVAKPLMFPIFILAVVSVVPNVLQTGFLFSTESISPKLSKLNPLAGLKRIFSANASIEMGKNLVKLAIIGSIVTWLLIPELARVDQLVGLDLVDVMAELKDQVIKLLAGVLAILLVLAAGDVFYQHYSYYKKMRMTKQDVKEEYKQAEGDPMIKMRLRQIRMERARRRMMAAVPKATVVVTNPTHYAVALLYEPESMPAPKLVAKGADLVAKRIRDLAREHNVPIVENPPVARALFASVELDQVVPPEHYKVGAEIISFVFKLKRKALPK
ncbi:MAG: flagellar biosynthesis protein FlhB [Alphaproteobacteria bacterium]|nr:flagellar biosynthesis protein FlhB [Alphaproteobacteria bacterium]